MGSRYRRDGRRPCENRWRVAPAAPYRYVVDIETVGSEGSVDMLIWAGTGLFTLTNALTNATAHALAGEWRG
jgi:hypothetical protein